MWKDIYLIGLNKPLKGDLTMNGNIKYLALIMMITVTALFILVTTAAAAGNDWKAIHGQYAATSVVSSNGYYPDGTLEGSGTVSQLAIYTFNGDGTGRMQGRFVRIGFLPAPNENPPPLDSSWNFTYEVADNGSITVTTVPGTAEWKIPGTDIVVLRDTGGGYSDSGWVSVDHKTIVLGTLSVQDQELTVQPDGPVFLTKSNASRVLIRVGE
jgi:hypothetical protein